MFDLHSISMILKFSLVIAFLNLDLKNVITIGFSRPIIAGAILGYFSGNFQFGIFAGCIIDLLMINQLPIGAYIPPNSTVIIGLVVTISYYFHVYKAYVLFPVILIYAVFWGHVAKRVQRLLWMKNSIFAERFLKGVEKFKFSFLRYNLMAFFIDLFLFIIIAFVGNLIGIFIFSKIYYIITGSGFINFIFEKIIFYLPLFSLLFIVRSFDVKNKLVFIAVGMTLAFLLDLIIDFPLLILIIIGTFSFIGLYSFHLYREHSYEI